MRLAANVVDGDRGCGQVGVEPLLKFGAVDAAAEVCGVVWIVGAEVDDPAPRCARSIPVRSAGLRGEHH